MSRWSWQKIRKRLVFFVIFFLSLFFLIFWHLRIKFKKKSTRSLKILSLVCMLLYMYDDFFRLGFASFFCGLKAWRTFKVFLDGKNAKLYRQLSSRAIYICFLLFCFVSTIKGKEENEMKDGFLSQFV